VKEPDIKDSALRRRAREHEEAEKAVFPGNGTPKVNKSCEIMRVRKRVQELKHENELLKDF